MDSLLEKKLQAKGAVLIEGPKWCGKTTTAEEVAASKILLARNDVKNNFKSLFEIDTDAALSGDTLHTAVLQFSSSVGFLYNSLSVYKYTKIIRKSK